MSLRSILLHPAVWFVVATVATIAVSISLWNRYQHKIVVTEKYQLNNNNIRMHQPEPSWAQASIKELLLARQSSVLENQLVPQTAEMIRSLGWVEQVRRIEKSSNGLDIDVSFRHPVAMVKINDQQALPVDRNGFVMDGDLFSSEAVKDMLRISVFRPLPTQTSLMTWQAWPDERILEAAAISEALQTRYQGLELFRVVSFQLPGDRAKQEPFEVWTHGHIRPGDVTQTPYAAKVIWGNAPGRESPGEASPMQKIQAMDNFVVSHGPLAKSIPTGKMLDVRSGKAVVSAKIRTAKQKNFSDSIVR